MDPICTNTDILQEVLDRKMTGFRVRNTTMDLKRLFFLIFEGNREWECACDLHSVARDLS